MAIMRFCCLIAGLLLALSASAQPAPKLNSVSPEWIQRGTTRELVLSGENLGQITQIIFNGEPGLSATNVPVAAAPAKMTLSVESTGGGITRAEPVVAQDEKRLVLKVTATAEAVLVPRELRVVGPGGVSNPLNLNVGQWAEVNRQETNTTAANAQPVDLPAVISGAVSAASQTNFYRFHAEKGQELVLDLEAARRGSPLDSSLVVLDAQGKELMRSEDGAGLDSLLFFTAPSTGDYSVALSDFRYRGGGNYTYRLTAGRIPYVESYFPFGAQRGKTVEVALQGYNLDGTTKMTLNIEPKARRSQELRFQTTRGYSNLLPFDVTDLPELGESEPNNAVTNAQSIQIPAVINGKIAGPKDVDRFRFKSASDQKLVCDAMAGRFGSKLDALIMLADAKGTVLQQNDDANGADARLEFDAKKDTEYVLTLRDLTERGGERFGYRLAIRPPSSAAGASFVGRFLPDSLRLNRGGTAKLRCEVVRNGGFEGPVRFTCENLPAGVYAESVTVPNAPHSGILLLSATAEATLGSLPLRVTASGMLDGKLVTVAAEPLNGERVVKQAYLTVLDKVPFAIETTTLSSAMEQNQAATLDVFVFRRDGFAGDVKIVAEGFSAGRDGLSKSFNGGETTIKAAETSGRITLTPRMDSEVGTRTVVLRGEATVDGRAVTTYSSPLPLSVAQFPLVLSSTLPRLSLTVLPPGSASAAGEAETKIRVERRAGFTGEVELAVEELPEGLKYDLPKIPANVNEVSLKLNATDKAALGTNFNFTVTARATFNDRLYKARTSRIALSVAAPEQVEVATNSTVPVPPAPTGTK